MSFVLPIVMYGRGCIEGPFGVKNIATHHGAFANAAQESGLSRFERDQATEDVEHVHQLRGVLGEPTVGLNPPERGRRLSVGEGMISTESRMLENGTSGLTSGGEETRLGRD